MNNSKITIEWHSILKDVIKNIWVVVMAALVGLMGVYIVSHSVYTPEYTSTSTLVVHVKAARGGSYTLFSTSSEMAEIFTKIFVEDSMKVKAAEHIGADGFDGTISAAVANDTNFIELKVTAADPHTAYELLSAVLEVYPEISNNVFNNAVISVIRQPSMPMAPSNSTSTESQKIVVSGCVAVVLFIILVLSVMRDTVKNEDAFKEKIEPKLLGVVHHENKRMTLIDKIHKKKKALLIHGNAFISLRFIEDFHKIAAKLEYLNRRNGDKVFAVTSVTENEGKSTTAANLAISLADRGKRVVLVDLDGKRPALYKIFNEQYEENSELSNLLSQKINKADFRLRRYKKTSLYLVLNTQAHVDYHKWIENGDIEKFLKVLKSKADYIIIDTAPLMMDAAVTNIVKMADKTVMVVRTDVVRSSVINDVAATIGKVGGDLVGCILNDVYPDASPVSFSGRDENNYYYGKKYGKYYSNVPESSVEEDSDERVPVNIN